MDTSKLPDIKQAGQCNCGAIKFNIDGKIMMNSICHCKPCARNFNVSTGAHLILTVPAGEERKGFQFTEGEDKLKITKTPNGKMTHAFCVECGSCVYQHPTGNPFKAVNPASFWIEDGRNCKVPDHYRPWFHVNYENRLFDTDDSLPKWIEFPHTDGVGLCDHQGNPLKLGEEPVQPWVDGKGLCGDRCPNNGTPWPKTLQEVIASSKNASVGEIQTVLESLPEESRQVLLRALG